MNILIIEDDLILWNHIVRVLDESIITNRITLIASELEFAQYAPQLSSYDIIITDLSLSREEHDFLGFKIIERVIERSSHIPIIVISWYGEIDTLRRAFELWATDYLIKPFRLKELEVRVCHWFQKGVLEGTKKDKSHYIHAGIVYDAKKNEFYKNNIHIELTRTQKYVFSLFFSRSNMLLSQEFLREKIWGDYDDSPERNLRIVILRLRRTLKRYNLDSALTTIRSEGYLFDTTLIQ